MKIFAAFFVFTLLCLDFDTTSADECSAVPNALMDYGINGIVHKQFAIKEIPTISVSGFSLTRGKIYGIDTLTRTCPVRTTQLPNGQIQLEACAGVDQIRVVFNVKFFLTKWMTADFLTVTIRGTRIKIGVSVEPLSGQSPEIYKFEVQELGNIKVKFTGPGSMLNKLINWVLSTRIRNKITAAIEENVAEAINKELLKVKLP